MLEFKDVFDGLVGVTAVITGWLVKSVYDRPTKSEVRIMIQDNQKLNNYAIDEIKEDIKEMKESNKVIQSELSILKGMLYKALNKTP